MVVSKELPILFLQVLWIVLLGSVTTKKHILAISIYLKSTLCTKTSRRDMFSLPQQLRSTPLNPLTSRGRIPLDCIYGNMKPALQMKLSCEVKDSRQTSQSWCQLQELSITAEP